MRIHSQIAAVCKHLLCNFSKQKKLSDHGVSDLFWTHDSQPIKEPWFFFFFFFGTHTHNYFWFPFLLATYITFSREGRSGMQSLSVLLPSIFHTLSVKTLRHRWTTWPLFPRFPLHLRCVWELCEAGMDRRGTRCLWRAVVRVGGLH